MPVELESCPVLSATLRGRYTCTLLSCAGAGAGAGAPVDGVGVSPKSAADAAWQPFPLAALVGRRRDLSSSEKKSLKKGTLCALHDTSLVPLHSLSPHPIIQLYTRTSGYRVHLLELVLCSSFVRSQILRIGRSAEFRVRECANLSWIARSIPRYGYCTHVHVLWSLFLIGTVIARFTYTSNLVYIA